MKREKLTWRRWTSLTASEHNAANLKLKKWQRPDKCEYGFNLSGELVTILDYAAMAGIFSIDKVTVK